MQRLDPRLRYLVTPEALETLEEQGGDEGEGEDGGNGNGSDDDSDGGGALVSTLSGISLQVRSCPHPRPYGSVALHVNLSLFRLTDASVAAPVPTDQRTSSV